MAGLDPAIHAFLAAACEDVDARDKPGMTAGARISSSRYAADAFLLHRFRKSDSSCQLEKAGAACPCPFPALQPGRAT
jgi:hypothetical protein